MYYTSAPGVAGAAGGDARESAIPAPRDDCECGYATTATTATTTFFERCAMYILLIFTFPESKSFF